MSAGINFVTRDQALKKDFGSGKLFSGDLFQGALRRVSRDVIDKAVQLAVQSGKPQDQAFFEEKTLAKIESLNSIRQLVEKKSPYEPITLRSIDKEMAYDMRRKNRKDFGLTVLEHIKDQIDTGSSWVILKNPFSYEMKKDFEHYVLWFKEHAIKGSMEDRVSLIADRMFTGKEIHYYCQDVDHRSIPEVVHWHLLVKKDFDLSGKSLQMQALLPDCFIG